MAQVVKKIVIGVIAVNIVVLILVFAFLPSETHIERTINIDAPRELVYAQVVDLREFHKWSPWTGRDPDAVYEFSDPSNGVDAYMSWSGNDQVGTGAMQISQLIEGEGIELELDFGPQGVATSTWLFEQNGVGTKATWAFDCYNGMNPIARVFGAFFLDGMIGPDYETGLQNLKDRCERLNRESVEAESGDTFNPEDIELKPTANGPAIDWNPQQKFQR